jgi:hypothetical protein
LPACPERCETCLDALRRSLEALGVRVQRHLCGDAETVLSAFLTGQVLWGFTRRWVAGLRGEWADGDIGAYDVNDRFRGERFRVSPNLTFYPTGFSKIRVQYNVDDGERFGTEHSVWVQFEFLLGTHGAHKF